jgi:D-alanine--poly(phosphoribitol) ligase subunit 2|tara:strand:- start:368 stop:610 length:243 start_codon:yes stop_codon:yes gene_type:complete
LEIQNQIANWISQNKNIEKVEHSVNFFDSGYLDSFDMILLIEFCEERFSISFQEFHFEDRRFPSVDGLTTIILEIQAENP